MKIAHFCEFADRRCGVFRSALEIAKRQKEKGNLVWIFTTHFMKDYSTSQKVQETIEGITCTRIKARKLGGEAFNVWDVKEEDFSMFNELWSHGYRKHHNIFLLDYACELILVTHAPWGSSSIFRTITTKLFDWKYSKTIREEFNIYHIANWEKEHTLFEEGFKLIELPLRKEFMKPQSRKKRLNKVLFVGNKKKIQPFLDYAKDLGVTIVTDCFDAKELVDLYDSHKYFLLVSKREGLPTGLREAKARGCITIATRNNGTLEVGADYFFDYGDWDGISKFIINVTTTK